MATRNEPHIGHLIEAELKRQGRSVVWLAEQLCCHRNNVYLIFRREWIDTLVLKKVALALRHDFFADLSDDFRNTLSDDHNLPGNAKWFMADCTAMLCTSVSRHMIFLHIFAKYKALKQYVS